MGRLSQPYAPGDSPSIMLVKKKFTKNGKSKFSYFKLYIFSSCFEKIEVQAKNEIKD